MVPPHLVQDQTSQRSRAFWVQVIRAIPNSRVNPWLHSAGPVAPITAQSLQRPRAGITRKCSKPAFFAPLPIVVVPDKRWRAQRASSLLAFLLRLLIQQLKGPGCKGLTAHSTQKRVQGEKGRSGKEWNQPVSRFQMGTLIQQEPCRNTFPIRACGKRLKAQAPESRRPGLVSQRGHLLAM